MEPSFDLAPSRPLKTTDAVAAIIHTGDGRYLLQLRDAIRTIFYPAHWGFFGGAIDPGETAEQTLRRELHEELALDLDGCTVADFGRFRFDVAPVGIEAIDRHYYDIRVDPALIPALRLGEGAAMELVDGEDALHRRRLVPYDGFALWLHRYQGMLAR